jgi:PEP-CTERM motif
MKCRATWSRTIGVAASLCGVALAALAGPVTLAPALAGQYAAGSGVDAEFMKVADDWHQSTVLWKEVKPSEGSDVAIGSLSWGCGLWGLADWHTLNQSPGLAQSRWQGRVGSISFGDAAYNGTWGTTWGNVALAPLFTGAEASQDNWSSHFFGYLRISQAGAYNFSVLHDDGFFFRLGGADGQTLELSHDFLNPRDRLGFATDLMLDVGLYAFELGGYDRLGSGVVDLAWARDGSALALVPTENLVARADVQRVPEPGSLPLALAGLSLAGALTLRRQRTPG